jgi:hypothetical protein
VRGKRETTKIKTSLLTLVLSPEGRGEGVPSPHGGEGYRVREKRKLPHHLDLLPRGERNLMWS